ncbi:class I adenylate-forming enzyme family protein [Nakamurella lactea]|uniref:class I adenylate-forming enzyme family protein n=1 Tax=Nakamurella lactea TaxID=459515 RepID=UPI000411D8CF|nr:class I adenylate-forming enzyme family protein [Nakamurella lactea]
MSQSQPELAAGRSEFLPNDPEVPLRVTIGTALRSAVQQWSAEPAFHQVVSGRLQPVSYAELLRRVTPIADALTAATEPGERVAVWSQNCTEWILLEYACALSGTILTPYSTAWSDGEVRHATELTTPGLAFVGTDSRGRSVAGRARSILGGVAVHRLADLAEWAAAQQVAVQQVDGSEPDRLVSPDDPFLIQFTSGTTGRSKGALVSHRAGLNAGYLRARHDRVVLPGDTWLNPVPYYHVAGSCSVILGAVTTGGSFVVLPRYEPDQAVGLIDAGGITRLGGVPIMVEQILDALVQRGSTPRLNSVPTGGATVSQALVRRIGDTLGATVVVGYGQSECPIITNSDLDDPPEVIERTVGRPVEGTRLRLLDPQSGAVVPLGAVGEIAVKSPVTMNGYFGQPDATREAFTDDGFLRTGDLASMDELGRLTFFSRAREVIIRGGENIYPAEVEEVLLSHPAVRGATVVGIDDEHWGEQVAAVIQLTPGAHVTGDGLREWLYGELAHFKIPKHWVFADEVPMTSSGKVRRLAVRDDLNASLR